MPTLLVKYIPYWFPGAGFKRKAKEWYKSSPAMLRTPYETTKEQIVGLHLLFILMMLSLSLSSPTMQLEGTARPSMMTQLLETHMDTDKRVKDEEINAGALAGSYAGLSITYSAILHLIKGGILVARWFGHGKKLEIRHRQCSDGHVSSNRLYRHW